jgi:hypothetical protein
MSMAYVTDMAPKSSRAVKKMSLDEFVKSAGSDEVQKMFRRVTGGSYSGCHCIFFEATGIWIPELVPVFQKLDAIMALRGEEIRPQGV